MAFGPDSTMNSSNEAEQEKILEDTVRIVKTQAFEMKRCLDRKEVMDGLRFANTLLAELRITTLSPKFYYRLYIDITNELQHFLSFLEEEYLGEDGDPKKIAEMYELVQFAGNIIPRLYLMITVGVAYIKSKSKEASRKDILRDLLDMCRGVQNPLKGLFLRNYLLQSTKELLPVGPPPTDGSVSDDGDINDAIDFTMTNFSEMNKLWFRSFYGPSKERDKRERERRELRILVGTNLVCLSKMELLDLKMYQTTILPGILEQVVSCKEPISQEYLMECLIQVFPDEFHVATLSEFLNACAELHPSVKIKNVFCAIIDRLAVYALSEEGSGIPADFDLFKIFSDAAETVITSRESIPPEDIVSIQKALANLSIKCYPDKVECTSTVFQSTASIFNRLKISNVPFNKNEGRELIKLLKLPVENYSSCLAIFELDAYTSVLNLLNYRGKTQVCTFIIQRIIETNSYITNEQEVEKLFTLLQTLVEDSPDQPKELESDEDFIEEQNQVSRLVHLITNDDPDLHFRLLSKVRKIFGKGGSFRLRYTLPPIIFATYKLLNRYAALRDQEGWEAKIKKIFHFCMNTISALKSETELYEICLKLLLQGALVSDQLNFEEGASITYEFISNGFSMYEEDLNESRVQVHCLSQLVGTVQKISGLPDENHEPLRNQAAMYANRLLKKPDQARSLCLVAHLFWHSQLKNSDGPLKDGQRVAECLKKAIKVSSQCMEDTVQLNAYLHILSNYLHFYELGCSQITSATVNQLIDKIRDSLLHLDPSQNSEHLNETFTCLLTYIGNQKERAEGDLRKALDELSL